MDVARLTIDVLPDEVLLEIFSCYVELEEYRSRSAWHTLARVCRRWRGIAYGSPRRLNLRIFCSERTPVSLRKKLDFWPPFPIFLAVDFYRKLGEDNILATLEHHDRVCHIEIWNISSSLWEMVLPLMQKPFPMLKNLCLRYTDEMASVVPDFFLGGSAPQLRKLNLEGISFPGLPNLLSSTTDLVDLELLDIPDFGYIAPEEMVTCISTLTRLDSLQIDFKSPRRRPEWGRQRTKSSSTRALLPSLTYFAFGGVSEYLEDIVDRINAPLLDKLRIRFFHQTIFDTPRLAQFISRAPKLKTCNEARMRLGSWRTYVKLFSRSKTTTNLNAYLLLEDWCGQPDFQLSPLVQFCTSSIPQALIPMVECLTIVGCSSPEQDDIGSSLWRELLQLFTAVKDLYLCPEITSRIALVMRELVGESVIELLPILQNLFLKELRPTGLVPEGIEQFVAARQLASHPVSVSFRDT